MERRSDWDGVVSGMRWEFWVFRDEVGVEVFVVERRVCWVYGGELGVG